ALNFKQEGIPGIPIAWLNRCIGQRWWTPSVGTFFDHALPSSSSNAQSCVMRKVTEGPKYSATRALERVRKCSTYLQPLGIRRSVPSPECTAFVVDPNTG